MKIDTNPSCNNPQEFIENVCKMIGTSILDSIICRISDVATGELVHYGIESDEISDLKQYLDISLKVARMWDKAINKTEIKSSQPEDECPNPPKGLLYRL